MEKTQPNSVWDQLLEDSTDNQGVAMQMIYIHSLNVFLDISPEFEAILAQITLSV